MKKILMILLGMLLFGGCMSSGPIGVVEVKVINGSEQIDNLTNQIKWEEAQYLNMTVLQPKNFENNQTVRIWDLIVESPNSIIIGGIQNGTPFATLSGQEIGLPTANATRIAVIVDRDFLSDSSYPGSKFMSNLNRDLGANSSAIVGTSDPQGNGNILQKFNENYRDPYLNVHAGLFGNMDIITTASNDFLPGLGSNRIRFGFYDNLSLRINDSTIKGYNGVRYSFGMNETQINSYEKHYFANYTFFNETYLSGIPSVRTSPPTPSVGNLVLFARDDGDFYIKRDNGQVRRITTANSGSNIWTEEQVFNNHTTFKGDIIFDNAVYNGGSHGIWCIDGNGKGYKSSSTTECIGSYTQSTIANASLGDEFDS